MSLNMKENHLNSVMIVHAIQKPLLRYTNQTTTTFLSYVQPVQGPSYHAWVNVMEVVMRIVKSLSIATSIAYESF
jgi:hypothetical protein